MKHFTDQLGRKVYLKDTPRRIVSLVPSQTEYLFDLGLSNSLVGKTRFCIHPHKGLESVTIVGGTKNIKTELIKELKPDLIIGNKEENVKEQLEELEKEIPVWISDVNTWHDAVQMMERLAELTERKEQYQSLMKQLNEARETYKKSIQGLKPIKVAYSIWKEPFMFAASDTFINALLEEMGFINVFNGDFKRYPAIDYDTLRNSQAEYLLLSTEPYPFKPSDQEELQKIFPNIKVRFIDGEYASWYGSRLITAYTYFNTLRTQLG